jgi:DNA-directed RNA polymerase subunit alpha
MAVLLGRFEMPKRVIKEEKNASNTYARFVAEPFEVGFGNTIGNSLRRVLLSSLEGAAITSVKIDGVQHEFSTIPGVIEDVVEVILNLKNIRMISHVREPQTLVLETKKKGPVTAADFETNQNIEILNKDALILTLSTQKKIRMEVEVAIGRGFSPAERPKSKDSSIGTIQMDAIFSPVTKVKYYTTNTRVGQLMNYDKLIIEIWTDGRLTPDEALKQASAVLRKHLDPFVDYDEHYIEFEKDEKEKRDENEEIKKLLNMNINEIELSVRAANCVAAANIKTIGELVQKSEPEMLKYRNFGKKSLNEIKEILTNMGLSLGMKVDHLVGPAPASSAAMEGEEEDDDEDIDIDEDTEDTEDEEEETEEKE